MSRSEEKFDEKHRKVIEVILNSYRNQIKVSIEQSMHTQIGTLDKQEIIGFLKHQGAGGTTFILSADFYANARRFRGGIVVKFANDLQQDVENANALNQLLSKRQMEWIQTPPKRPMPDMPAVVFSPAVLGTHLNKVIILEFINGGIPLLNADFSETKKYEILGYALGRLHGSQSYKTAMQLYEPIFKILASYFSTTAGKAALNSWKEWIALSEGGVEFIHGDSHLENLMYSTVSGSLAWIDALLIPRGDRMDDVAYAISHIIQEKLIVMLQEKPTASNADLIASILKQAVSSTVPVTMSAYMRTANVSGLYKGVIPIDFFLGAHLIIRSQLFTGNKLSELLISLGQELIFNRPIVKFLGLEKSS